MLPTLRERFDAMVAGRRKGSTLSITLFWGIAATVAVGAAACAVGEVAAPPPTSTLTLTAGSQVSALATGEIRLVASTGKLIGSRPLNSVPVGSAAAALSQTRRLASRLSATLVPPTPSAMVASAAAVSTTDVLSFLKNVGAFKSSRRLVGPSGRDTVFVVDANGHSENVVRTGPPGSPDTLTTVDQDGVRVLAVHTQWHEVTGGAVVHSFELDEYLTNGATLQVQGTLDNYTVTEAKLAPGVQISSVHLADFCVSSSSSCSDGGGGGGGGGDGGCAALLFTKNAADSAYIAALAAVAFSCSFPLPLVLPEACATALSAAGLAAGVAATADYAYNIACT